MTQSTSDFGNLTLPPAPLEYLELRLISEDDEANLLLSHQHLQSQSPQPFGVSEVFEGKVLEKDLLVNGEDVKKVYELRLTARTVLDFLPGDTIGILTKNLSEEVNLVLEHFDLVEDCDRVYRVVLKDEKGKKKRPIYIPEVITVRRVLEECLDLRSVPKKLFLRALAKYTSDSDERRRLEFLCSKEGASEYQNFIQEYDFLRLVRELDSCRPPSTVLMEHLPRLLPRPYSIANSPLRDPNSIEIVFSKLDQIRPLATGMLENTQKGDIIPFYFRVRTKFCFHEDDYDRDLILIGPGTAIAPFIGFLEHREELLKRGIKLGRCWLFTGFRYREKRLFLDRLAEFQRNGALDRLSEAFSRDTGSDTKYVQDQIKANSSDFVQWLLKGKLFVCGDGKLIMPEVEATVCSILTSINSMTPEEALAFVRSLKSENRYIEDTWL